MSNPEIDPLTYTDNKGRTLVQRIAAVERGGDPTTVGQQADAADLLADMLAVLALRGLTLDDADWVTNLPADAVDLVRYRDRRGGGR